MIRFETSLGNFTIELFPEQAPISAANFQQYAEDGHFDGTIFHRVINSFMIQGGGFEPGMKQKPTRAPIKNEAGNGLTNDEIRACIQSSADPLTTAGTGSGRINALGAVTCAGSAPAPAPAPTTGADIPFVDDEEDMEIGRASCRERG